MTSNKSLEHVCDVIKFKVLVIKLNDGQFMNRITFSSCKYYFAITLFSYAKIVYLILKSTVQQKNKHKCVIYPANRYFSVVFT